MTLDKAIETVNDPSLTAYCDWMHQKLYREFGEYDFGLDVRYDEIVCAYAFVAVELALDDDLFEFAPDAPDDTSA